MSSKPNKRVRGSFGFRLNLWYAAVFIVTASALFWLAYFILANTIQQKDRELVKARLDEYRAWYEVGGLPWLSRKFYNTPDSGKNAFFVRVASRAGDAVFVSIPDAWQGFDPKEIEGIQLTTSGGWYSMSGKGPGQVWLLAATPLADGRVLQVGKSTDQTAELLARFRWIFGLVMGLVVLLGFAAGAFFTRRALLPIRQLGDTVNEIVQTGRMDARVPARGNRDELDELVLLFNQMLAKNEALIRAMRESLDNVAHDLRTPMARLRGQAEQALQSGDPAACREALADAVEESEKLMTMLKTLMDISEAETGTMRLEYASVPIATLTREVMDVYQILAEEKQITVETRIPETLTVQADLPRLRQCLANLVDNAIKYTGAGGRVEIAAAPEGSQIVISVTDNGTGVSPEDIPRIWERLYRGDKSRHEKGLGLGLSLVKAFVQAHGGTVQVESQVGKGSVFSIRLPARQ
jgi:signal transduction histidine kinase